MQEELRRGAEDRLARHAVHGHAKRSAPFAAVAATALWAARAAHPSHAGDKPAPSSSAPTDADGATGAAGGGAAPSPTPHSSHGMGPEPTSGDHDPVPHPHPTSHGASAAAAATVAATTPFALMLMALNSAESTAASPAAGVLFSRSPSPAPGAPWPRGLAGILPERARSTVDQHQHLSSARASFSFLPPLDPFAPPPPARGPASAEPQRSAGGGEGLMLSRAASAVPWAAGGAGDGPQRSGASAAQLRAPSASGGAAKALRPATTMRFRSASDAVMHDVEAVLPHASPALRGIVFGWALDASHAPARRSLRGQPVG